MNKYSVENKFYWASMKKWYDNNRAMITKSKNIIHVDFKEKKIIKGSSQFIKNVINKAA